MKTKRACSAGCSVAVASRQLTPRPSPSRHLPPSLLTMLRLRPPPIRSPQRSKCPQRGRRAAAAVQRLHPPLLSLLLLPLHQPLSLPSLQLQPLPSLLLLPSLPTPLPQSALPALQPQSRSRQLRRRAYLAASLAEAAVRHRPLPPRQLPLPLLPHRRPQLLLSPKHPPLPFHQPRLPSPKPPPPLLQLPPPCPPRLPPRQPRPPP